MAISFIGSAVGSVSPNGTFNVTLPGGMQADDLILVAFSVGDTSASDTNLAVNGFTEVADLFIGTDTNDNDLFVGYRYHVAGETQVPTSGNFTAVGGTNASNAAVVMVFRGVALAADGGPFDTAAVTATGIDTSNANPPSMNHSGAAGVWTVIVGSTGHTGGATGAFTFPTNYTTNAVQRNHDDTVDTLVGMGYRSNPANPEDPAAFTAANIGTAANNSWCAVTMALKPAPETRRMQVSFAEMEVPTAPRRMQVSFAELEVGTAPRRAQVSWAELEVPDVNTDRRMRLSFAEMEVPTAPRRLQLSFAELEMGEPPGPRRMQVSYAAFETADPPRRMQVSYAVFEVPSVGGEEQGPFQRYYFPGSYYPV